MEKSTTGGIKSESSNIYCVDYFWGWISLVSVPPKGKVVNMWKYLLTSTRNVDGLSPQFASAMAMGVNFPTVTIQTWGHVVTLQKAEVVYITKAGKRNPHYPHSAKVDPGMEAIMWQSLSPILVDGERKYANYDWKSLSVPVAKGHGA